MLVAENNAIGAIDGAFSDISTTLKLVSMTGMPVLDNVDQFCILTLIRASDNAIEYVKCTAQDIPARTYTVLRGQEDSIPLDFVDADEARNLWTKGQIDLVLTEPGVGTLLSDGTVALEANLDANAFTIENLPDALNAQEPTTLNQVEGLIVGATQSLKVHAFAQLSTIGGTLAVYDSEGFTTITRSGTGSVAFVMPTAGNDDYLLNLTCKGGAANPYIINEHESVVRTATTFNLRVNSTSDVNKDADQITVIVYVRS